MPTAAQTLIERYYPEDNALRRLLIAHSEQVRDRALRIARQHPELRADEAFLAHAAMLHDIGIYRCHAPGIHCHGTAPYMLHGTLGAALLRAEGDEATARVCERHTGVGLLRSDFAARGLEIPPTDLLPETIEEQIICYADKFYSKSHVGEERSLEATAAKLAKFGAESVEKFRAWAARFE